ncbi:MAG: ATP-binding cassette domain-containing protein [Alphaproteobacteria bacterium]|nr:ATP-binding cassette domain-containing protein [Alphaproteobacteria bacterium]
MSMALELRGLARVFNQGGADATTALAGVDLALEAGDFVTLIGSNGAGKSTLLRCITGHERPDSGSIVLDGADITGLPVHRRAGRIGRIAQDPRESSCASMSIAENLAMAALRGQSRGFGRAVTQPRRARFRDLLAETGLGLEDRMDARMGTLSGGQRQAVALLMATLAEPGLLLLDEHLAALDPRAAALVMELTARRIAANQLTSIMVTHDMQAAIAWGGRLVMMHAGRVVLDVQGTEKSALTVPGLVERFRAASGAVLASDRALLTL